MDRQTALAVVVWAFVAAGAHPAAAAINPAAVFQNKCASCHTFGKGTLVGPDLKGVNDRHPRAWLRLWIRSPERAIKSGDRIAKELFLRFKEERMPDQTLSADDIDALLDYLAAGGPAESARPIARNAITASPAEIGRGRDLFFGLIGLSGGGAPCGACHSVRTNRLIDSATFGGDLSSVYSRFQDAALSEFLEHPCFPREPRGDGAAPLTNTEAFAVKAFLRSVDARFSPARR